MLRALLRATDLRVLLTQKGRSHGEAPTRALLNAARSC